MNIAAFVISVVAALVLLGAALHYYARREHGHALVAFGLGLYVIAWMIEQLWSTIIHRVHF